MSSELAKFSEPSQVSSQMKVSRLDDSLYSKELAPHYMQLATKLASSELIPKSYRGKPQDLFVCWAMGYQMGLTPEQSQQCIAVINGRPCMWGDDMLALCMSHRDFVDIIENPIIKNDVIIGYNCTVKRKGRTDKEGIFTLDMAKKAGLLAKGGVWSQYPERMLKLRARGYCLRDAFPDALKGIKPREEVEDYIVDADYTPSEHKGSRTERLKQEITKTQGGNHVDEGHTVVVTEEDKLPLQENSKDSELSEEAKNVLQKVDIHTEIKRLISEKGLSEERLDKALKFYEIENIDSLDARSAEHFKRDLAKL